MIRWSAFTHNKQVYDLTHLHPETMVYLREPKGDKPEERYTVDVVYSLHCFTRDCEEGEAPDAALFYSDNRETRIFDFERWKLSHQLPGIVRGLMERRCFHTGHRNYLTVELVSEEGGAPIKYHIYFQVSKAARRGILTLYIQSAYAKDKPEPGKPKHNPPIRFAFILHNTLHGIAIKVPK